MKKAVRISLGIVCLLMLGTAVVAGEDASLEKSKLAQKTAGLKPGQWVEFDGPPKSIGSYGISWQGTTGFWDAKRREFQFMGKGQGGMKATHWIYSEADHAWRGTLKGLIFGGGKRALPGHVWSRSFDATTGDYYFMDCINRSKFFRFMTRETEAGKGSESKPWKESSKPEFRFHVSHTEEIGFHPNLYGKGDGGVIVWGGLGIAAWRKKTNTWQSIMKYASGNYHGSTDGCGQYLPGFDRLVMGTGSGKRRFMLIDAGKDGKLAEGKPRLEKSPIFICGKTSGMLKKAPWGKLVVHPSNDKGLVILGPMPDYKVWTNTTGGTADGWKVAKHKHPFTKENLPMTGGDWGAWTCGSVSTHGVIWAMAYDGKTSKSVLWKPPAGSK